MAKVETDAHILAIGEACKAQALGSGIGVKTGVGVERHLQVVAFRDIGHLVDGFECGLVSQAVFRPENAEPDNGVLPFEGIDLADDRITHRHSAG